MIDLHTWRWQRSILAEARKRLGRDLTDVEKKFITSRGGYLALEMIEDTVRTLSGGDLERYLRSESACRLLTYR